VLPTGNEVILAVDDEELIVKMQKVGLEQLGYRVIAKTDSQDALQEFQANPKGFNLVITDQTMPQMTGSLLSKALLQIRPELAIVLCTGYSSIISKEKAQEIGIKKFLMKPVDRKDLATTVREVLDGSK